MGEWIYNIDHIMIVPFCPFHPFPKALLKTREHMATTKDDERRRRRLQLQLLLQSHDDYCPYCYHVFNETMDRWDFPVQAVYDSTLVAIMLQTAMQLHTLRRHGFPKIPIPETKPQKLNPSPTINPKPLDPKPPKPCILWPRRET